MAELTAEERVLGELRRKGPILRRTLPGAGDLFRVKTDLKGLLEPAFTEKSSFQGWVE